MRGVLPIVHSRAMVRAASLAALATLVGACFDWAVRVSPTDDAAAPRDGAIVDDDRAPPDVDAPDTSPPSEAGPSCSDLVADVVTSRNKARRCSLGAGQCAVKVKDECDCDWFVAVVDSPETMTFEAKVALARAAGCRDHCASCAFLPTQGTCLAQGQSSACSP